MNPLPAVKRGRDGAQTRADIEREALRLFAAQGVDATSTRDIAQAVGVAEAALYRYFKSKEEIGRSIFTQHYGALAGKIVTIASQAIPFPRKARALVALFCALFDDEPNVFAFLLLNQHAHLRFVPEAESANAVEAVRNMMRLAFARGEIGESNADLAAAMALGCVVQPAVFKIYGRIEGPLAQHVETLTVAAMRAVRAR